MKLISTLILFLNLPLGELSAEPFVRGWRPFGGRSLWTDGAAWPSNKGVINSHPLTPLEFPTLLSESTLFMVAIEDKSLWPSTPWDGPGLPAATLWAAAGKCKARGKVIFPIRNQTCTQFQPTNKIVLREYKTRPPNSFVRVARVFLISTPAKAQLFTNHQRQFCSVQIKTLTP